MFKIQDSQELALISQRLNFLENKMAEQQVRLSDLQFVLQKEQLRERGNTARLLFNRYERDQFIRKLPLPEIDETRAVSLSNALDRLRTINPSVYDTWMSLFNVNVECYEGFPVDSCSVWGHPISPLFGDFIQPYLFGNVLDVGCGPQPLPNYLDAYPLDRIFGIDPIDDKHKRLFSFYQGVAEYLPWKDNSFHNVIVATSLDHVLYLDKVLAEFKRVLAPSGWLLLWVHFTPGATPYNPYVPHMDPLDKFHLFHFDKDWFESLFKQDFTLGEDIHLSNVYTYRGSFYSWQIKK